MASRSRSPRRQEAAQTSTLDLAALTVDAQEVLEGSDWTKSAAAIFREHRVVVVRNLFDVSTTEQLMKSMTDLHQTWSAAHDPSGLGNRLPGRYDLGSAFNTHHLTHLPGYLEALQDFASRGGLALLRDLGGYKFVGGQGQLCLAKTLNWQPLHSDVKGPWSRALQPLAEAPEHVPVLEVMVTVHPLTQSNGAMRILPGQPPVDTTYQQDKLCNKAPTLDEESDASKRSQLFPLPAGCGILRDIRVWHGGVPNLSSEDRYIAVLQFYSCWCLDLGGERRTEGRGVAQADVLAKLDKEAQSIVADHIIRADGDPEPWSSGKWAIWQGDFVY